MLDKPACRNSFRMERFSRRVVLRVPTTMIFRIINSSYPGPKAQVTVGNSVAKGRFIIDFQFLRILEAIRDIIVMGK